MKYKEALDEGIKETIGGLSLAAMILLSSLGISKQNINIKLAKEFLNKNTTYIEKLNDLKDLDRFNKKERRKVIDKWKKFVDSQGLDSKLAKNLKIAGEGELSSYRRK